VIDNASSMPVHSSPLTVLDRDHLLRAVWAEADCHQRTEAALFQADREVDVGLELPISSYFLGSSRLLRSELDPHDQRMPRRMQPV
jgi:hypothetical protein